MHLSAFISTIAFTLLAACGGSQGQITAPTTPNAPREPSCPVTVTGTSVTVEDTTTGAALVFVTTGDEAELRRRVAAMATTHNEQHAAMGPLPTGAEAASGAHHDHHGHHGHHGAPAATGDGTINVHSAARTEDIGDGARLEYVVAPADVATLQTELRAHAHHLATGTCEMAP